MATSKNKKLKAEVKEPTKTEVRKMAKDAGLSVSHRINVAKPVIKTMNKHKEQLIKEIQAAEGNSVCYKSGITDCDATGCLWFSTCQ